MKKIILYVIGGLAVVILTFIINGGGQAPEVSNTGNSLEELKVGVKISNLAPDFSLRDYGGNEVKLSDFKGEKGVFVNFWATWCPFCVDELPLMGDTQVKYEGQYITLAINRAESKELAKEFSDNLGVTDKMIFLMDPNDFQYFKYGGFAMPYSIFIGKDGVIRDLKLGPLTEQELESKIQKII